MVFSVRASVSELVVSGIRLRVQAQGFSGGCENPESPGDVKAAFQEYYGYCLLGVAVGGLDVSAVGLVKCSLDASGRQRQGLVLYV